MSIYKIDFGRLYREHMAAAGGHEKPPEYWDGRVAEMNRRVGDSTYVRAFIDRMDLSNAATLLDVGCGTGSIALALAGRMQRVYALDYSRGMLEALMKNAAARGLSNVAPIHCAWEDDWRNVPECDIVVASRSTTVMDMADALAKLDAKAKQHVYLTSLVGGRFMESALARRLGRERQPLPDYIYIINILYQMGRHPRLDYIESDNRLAGTDNFDDFAQRVASCLGELSNSERALLADWYAADPERARRGGEPFRWAFVSWETKS